MEHNFIDPIDSNVNTTLHDVAQMTAAECITAQDNTVPESGLRSAFGMKVMVVFFSLLTILTLMPLAAHADNKLSSLFGAPKSKFLTVNQAFQTIPTQDGRNVSVDFVVTPKHYIYKNRVKIILPNNKQLTPLQFNQKHKVVNDPEFGKVPVFEKNVRLSTVLPNTVKAGDTLTLHWQGCAKAGLCYPPVKEKITVKSLKKKRK